MAKKKRTVFPKWLRAECAPPDSHNIFVVMGIGKRTLKTALAVLICLLLDFATGHGMPINACIAAILTMQASQRESFHAGRTRLLGTAIGGAIGLAMLGLYSLLPNPVVKIVLATLGVMLAISISCIIHNQDAAALTAIVVLGITLQQGADNTVEIALWQVGETAVGVVVAVLVNHFVARPKHPPAAVLLEEERKRAEQLKQLATHIDAMQKPAGEPGAKENPATHRPVSSPEAELLPNESREPEEKC